MSIHTTSGFVCIYLVVNPSETRAKRKKKRDSPFKPNVFLMCVCVCVFVGMRSGESKPTYAYGALRVCEKKRACVCARKREGVRRNETMSKKGMKNKISIGRSKWHTHFLFSWSSGSKRSKNEAQKQKDEQANMLPCSSCAVCDL